MFLFTGTYKLKKNVLQEEGFNKDQIKDPLYFLDVKDSKYISLTKELYGDIISGTYRLWRGLVWLTPTVNKNKKRDRDSLGWKVVCT